ncbi:hypothetical protein Aduo_001162 [Ancylostoma duodenale]
MLIGTVVNASVFELFFGHFNILEACLSRACTGRACVCNDGLYRDKFGNCVKKHECNDMEIITFAPEDDMEFITFPPG